MAMNVTDSLFMDQTGRTLPDNEIGGFVDFILRRLVALGIYSTQSSELAGWTREMLHFLLVWNNKLPRPFDPYFIVTQIWHETAGMTSLYYTRDGNLAGIGIWQGGVPSPWEGKLSPEDAAKVYLAELIAHTGTRQSWDSFVNSDVGAAFAPALRKDASHLEKLWELRRSVVWPDVQRIEQLNDKVGQWDYVWALDSQYPEKIVALSARIFGDIPDAKKGTTPTMGVNIGNRPLRIAIGAGHRNTSGGNQFEAALNAKCTAEIVKLARASTGFEIRSYTGENGDGFFNGPLDAAARTVNTWYTQGWHADILHEVHHEGTAPSIRGGFWIYPDSAGLVGRNAGNTDIDVKNEAGRMAQILVAEFGGICRYANCGRGMSEKETGVGGDGYRLGVFGAWSEPHFNNQSFQMLSEAAAYTNPTDLAIMQQPDYPRKHAIGVLKAYAHLAKARGNWTFPYKIGEKVTIPTEPDNRPKGPDGTPIPEGLDMGILAILFGDVRPLGTGAVSKAWYRRGKETGYWPALRDVFTDRTTGRQYYIFTDGSVFWRPSRNSAFRWLD